jgi:glycine cleavage system transcriptional repressor
MLTLDHKLILTAIGPDSSVTLSAVSKACSKAECHIVETKTQKIGNDLAILMVLAGSWHALAKLEASLPTIQKKTDLTIQIKRSQTSDIFSDGLPYQVQIVAEDRSGILSDLCAFFSRFAVSIDDCSAETYMPHRSTTRMCSLQMNLRVCAKTHIATLREKFLNYCEDRNLDAVFEPIKLS